MATLLLIDVRSQKAILTSNEENKVQLISQMVQDDLQNMNSDLFYLANLPPLKNYLDAEVLSSDLIAEDFLLFSKHRKIYDQIRYLDNSGMEIVRINFDGHSSTIVPSGQLQSKAGRYYFKSTLELSRGEVYVSPFDLNVENGAVERPFKPMLRVSTPVFDNEGLKRGFQCFGCQTPPKHLAYQTPKVKDRRYKQTPCLHYTGMGFVGVIAFSY